MAGGDSALTTAVPGADGPGTASNAFLRNLPSQGNMILQPGDPGYRMVRAPARVLGWWAAAAPPGRAAQMPGCCGVAEATGSEIFVATLHRAAR